MAVGAPEELLGEGVWCRVAAQEVEDGRVGQGPIGSTTEQRQSPKPIRLRRPLRSEPREVGQWPLRFAAILACTANPEFRADRVERIGEIEIYVVPLMSAEDEPTPEPLVSVAIVEDQGSFKDSMAV